MPLSDTSTTPIWDPFEAPVDPFPIYRALRDLQPVYHNSERGFWALSRFADVQAANRDWQTFSYAYGVDIDHVGAYLQPGNFLHEDPPAHKALRGIVKDDFRIGPLRETFTPIVRAEVEELLTGLRDDNAFDFGLDLAWELPIRIGSHLLGFARDDCARLRQLSDRAFLRADGWRPREEDVLASEGHTSAASATSGVARPAVAIRRYFEEEIEARRRSPANDMLSRLAMAEIDGEALGDAAAGIAAVIFGGSVDTTALTLTTAVELLARHPDQRAWLAKHLDKLPQAVEEVLRFDGPVQVFRRTTMVDVDVHGTTIPSGEQVYLIYGAANRDERQFERPDDFDVSRAPKRHLAFGEGIHHCIGAPLARVELEVALKVLLERSPHYAIISADRVSGPLRGFRSLKLRHDGR